MSLRGVTRRVWLRPLMWRALLPMALSVLLAAPLFVTRGQATIPLAVNLSRLQWVAPGRARVDVTITGLQPELQPTIEGSTTLGGQVTQFRPPFPLIVSRFSAFLDLPAGRVRIGGDATARQFPPVPPLEENTSATVEVSVRQGDETATAQQTGVLLLPTIIIPGYLNELAAKPDPAVMAVLEKRGYRAQGASPDLFWFTYPSRRLGLEEGARALVTYVREVVLTQTYAARINVVAYSLGGLLARWNLAFEPGWDHLVNRFVMVGVPNEGAVLSYVDGWYPLAAPWARTPAARNLRPTFPFWRPTREAPWSFPPDGQNPALGELNTHPLPDGIRAYAFYGNRQPDPDGRGTWAGITGQLPAIGFSSGPGDGLVLTASALGLPINGGGGVPGLAGVVKVDLGAVRHTSLLGAAISKIANVLTDERAASQSTPSRKGKGWVEAIQGVEENGIGLVSR